MSQIGMPPDLLHTPDLQIAQVIIVTVKGEEVHIRFCCNKEEFARSLPYCNRTV